MSDRVFGDVAEGTGEGDFTDENLVEGGVESRTDLEGNPIEGDLAPIEGDPKPPDPVLDFQKSLTDSGLTYKNEHELLTGHQNLVAQADRMGNELGDLRKMGAAFTQLQDFYKEYFEDGGDGKLYLTPAAIKEFSRNDGNLQLNNEPGEGDGNFLPQDMTEMNALMSKVASDAIKKQMEPFQNFMNESEQARFQKEEDQLNGMVQDHISEALKDPGIKKNFTEIQKLLKEQPSLYSCANSGKNPFMAAYKQLLGGQELEARKIRLNKNPKGLHSLDAGVQGDGETNSSEENVLNMMKESGSADGGVYK